MTSALALVPTAAFADAGEDAKARAADAQKDEQDSKAKRIFD